jgi:hypothetical protein
VDFDLLFHKFKTVQDSIGTRKVEHIMVVEVKTGTEKMTPAAKDSLSVLSGSMSAMIPINGDPINVKSRPGFIRKGEKKIQLHGVHLLRVPYKDSDDPIFIWDGKHHLNGEQLAKVLDFVNDPQCPFKKLDTDRRHKPSKIMPLFNA